MGSSEGGWRIPARITAAAVIGGTASEVGGGKFVNGAVTSAFQQLFNGELSKAAERSYFENIDKKVYVVLLEKGIAEKAGDDWQRAANGMNYRLKDDYVIVDSFDDESDFKARATYWNGRAERGLISTHGTVGEHENFEGRIDILGIRNSRGTASVNPLDVEYWSLKIPKPYIDKDLSEIGWKAGSMQFHFCVPDKPTNPKAGINMVRKELNLQPLK
jgi:hypothetical protein